MANEESIDYEKALPLQLGALRSQMRLTIHTFHSLRLWRGRAPSGETPGIIGLNGYLSINNKMIRGAALDDPYSDWWMLRVEEKVESVKNRFAEIKEQLEAVYSHVPPMMSLGENLNLQPVTLQVFASSPLGFLGIYLLADFDEIVRRLILALHIALIDRGTHDRYLTDGGHEMRSLFATAQFYRYSGATRQDFAAGNAVALAAQEKFGTVPQDIMEGKRRSRFAPVIRTQAEEEPAAFEELPQIDQTDLTLSHESAGLITEDAFEEAVERVAQNGALSPIDGMAEEE